MSFSRVFYPSNLSLDPFTQSPCQDWFQLSLHLVMHSWFQSICMQELNVSRIKYMTLFKRWDMPLFFKVIRKKTGPWRAKSSTHRLQQSLLPNWAFHHFKTDTWKLWAVAEEALPLPRMWACKYLHSGAGPALVSQELSAWNACDCCHAPPPFSPSQVPPTTLGLFFFSLPAVTTFCACQGLGVCTSSRRLLAYPLLPGLWLKKPPSTPL